MARAHGPAIFVHVPGLARAPVNGRNFEYVSGEDPCPGYTLVLPVVKRLQSQWVLANVKRFVVNNQETNREAVSATIDERARFEMYCSPVEGVIEAGLGPFVCS